MKKSTLIIVAALAALSFTSCSRIDAGHVGIKVKLYGSEKGVQDITEVTGWVWYNPISTSVYEVPTFVQNAIYTQAEERESNANEEFRVTTKDGLVAAFDVSINYSTPAENISQIFRKYRKPVEELNKTVVRNYLRDAFNNTASRFTAEMLYERREEFEALSDSAIRHILQPEGFIIEQVVILNELRLPEQVVHNINEKVNASQIAMKKQQEVAQAKADADKKIEEARGYAESLRIKSDAEKYSYEQKMKTLTPLLIQQQFIEQWDGKLPVYGTVPTLFKDISK